MAKFCQYCGTQLQDGQVCSCPQAQADAAQPQPEAVPQPQAAVAAPSPFGAAFKNLLPLCRAYLRSPVDATRAAIDRKDLILPVILLVIQAIVAGLVIFSFLSKVCATIENIVLLAMGFIGGYSSGLFSSGPSVSASFIMCLIFGILAAIIAIVVFAALIFGTAKIMKSDCSFQDVLIACGVNSLFVTVLLLLSFILFFVSVMLGIILFMLAMLTWVIMGVLTAQAVTPGTEQGRFWMLYIVAVLVALLIGGWISSKFFGMSIGATKISYAGESVKVSRMIDQIGDIDFENLIEDIIYNIF